VDVECIERGWFMLIKKMLFGYHDTQCLYIVTSLNIADYLQDAPKSIIELAKVTQTRPDKLFRIMRYLSSKGLFEALPDKRFGLNQNSDYLVSSNPENINNFICLHAVYFYRGASKLIESIKLNETSFELEFGAIAGHYFQEDRVAGEVYNNAMRENSELYGRLISELYDFTPYKTIVDVGGGIGSLLAHVLLKNKESFGINYDLPGLQNASENYFKAKGLLSRVKYVGGDFNQFVPDDGDIYIMKAILHAREDESAIKVLKQCKSVLPNHGKLLIIERVISTLEGSYVEACVNDINMLNVTLGKVRTLNEFKALFERTGLLIKATYPVTDAISILELEVI
jgi:SAM-dependent methyltransferase